MTRVWPPVNIADHSARDQSVTAVLSDHSHAMSATQNETKTTTFAKKYDSEQSKINYQILLFLIIQP